MDVNQLSKLLKEKQKLEGEQRKQKVDHSARIAELQRLLDSSR